MSIRMLHDLKNISKLGVIGDVHAQDVVLVFAIRFLMSESLDAILCGLKMKLTPMCELWR